MGRFILFNLLLVPNLLLAQSNPEDWTIREIYRFGYELQVEVKTPQITFPDNLVVYYKLSDLKKPIGDGLFTATVEDMVRGKASFSDALPISDDEEGTLCSLRLKQQYLIEGSVPPSIPKTAIIQLGGDEPEALDFNVMVAGLTFFTSADQTTNSHGIEGLQLKFNYSPRAGHEVPVKDYADYTFADVKRICENKGIVEISVVPVE